MVEFYHQIRPNKPVGEQQLIALEDVPFMPWLNKSMVLKFPFNQSPFTVDPEKMEQKIDEHFHNDVGEPISKYAYADIEPVYGKGTFADINVYKEIAYYIQEFTKSKIIFGIYTTIHKNFYNRRMPKLVWHDALDPHTQAITMSLFNRAKGEDLKQRMEKDKESVSMYYKFYSTRRHDRPVIAIISGMWKDSTIIPMDLFEDYIRHIIKTIPDPLVLTWARFEHDEDYANKINLIKKIITKQYSNNIGKFK